MTRAARHRLHDRVEYLDDCTLHYGCSILRKAVSNLEPRTNGIKNYSRRDGNANGIGSQNAEARSDVISKRKVSPSILCNVEVIASRVAAHLLGHRPETILHTRLEQYVHPRARRNARRPRHHMRQRTVAHDIGRGTGRQLRRQSVVLVLATLCQGYRTLPSARA